VIGSWAAELLGQAPDPADLSRWKVRHPDGREWVAFLVGTWIIDSIRELTGKSPAELVRTPPAEIAAMFPAFKRCGRVS
jgi:hypothetical protein